MTDLNVALILRLVDQVTGPSRAVLAAMRNVAGAVDGAGRGMIAGGEALNGVIARQREQLAGSALAVGAVGAGAAFAFKSLFVDVASQFEDFEATLRTVEGSSEAAKASMGWISDFAAKTPFDLASVTEAFVQMRSYGLDPTNGLLTTLGDTASAMNRPVMQAVEAIADAVMGENERLKELGITAAVDGSKVIYSYTDRFGNEMTQTVDKNNRAQITSTIQAIWNGKYGGAMAERGRNWNNMIANLGDHWSRFALAVMDAGVFDALKGQLGRLLDMMDQARDNGTLQFWAERTAAAMLQVGSAIGAVARVVGPVLQAMVGWAEANPEIATGLAQLAIVLAGAKVGMIALRLASIAFLSPLASILRIVGLVTTAVGGLVGAPFVALGAAAAAAAFVLYDNWGRIGTFFADKFAEVRAGFEAGWTNGVVAVLREFNPVTLIAEAMAGLVDYAGQKFAEVGAKIHDTLSGIDLYDAGVAMIQSLWNGAIALVDQMVAAIKARLAGMLPELPSWLGGGGEAAAPAAAVAGPRAPITPAQVNGGNTVTNVGDIVVNSTAADPKQVAREVKAQLSQAGQSGGKGSNPLFDQSEDAIGW